MLRILPLWLAVTGCDAVLRLEQVSTPDAPLTPNGLVADYPFEDSECAHDVIGEHDGTCPAGVPGRLMGPNKHGMAAMLDGTQFITVPHAAALDPTMAITIAAWISPTQYDRDGVTYSCMLNRPYGVGGGDSWQICARSTDTFFGFADVPINPPAIATGAWTHVALTWDGQTASAWINGALVEQKPAAQAAYDAQGIWIGADNDGSGASYLYIGAIDEIQIYNVALGAEEIVTLAQ